MSFRDPLALHIPTVIVKPENEEESLEGKQASPEETVRLQHVYSIDLCSSISLGFYR